MISGKPLFAFIGGGAGGVALVTTSDGTIQTFTVPFKCIPIRAGFTVTQAPGTAAPVLTFGALGICGILTIPLAAEVNDVIFEDTDYVSGGGGQWTDSLDEGDQVAVVVSSHSTSTGAGIPWLLVEVSPEIPANNSAMEETDNA